MSTKLNLSGVSRSREPSLHDPHALPGLPTSRSGAQTERAGGSSSGRESREEGRDTWELRRVIGENRKWRERCERLEWERDHARGEAERLADELAEFTERWQQREEGVRELEENIRELQRRLAESMADSVSTEGHGIEVARQMVNTWAGRAPPGSPFAPVPPSSAPPPSSSEGLGGRAMVTERFSGRLKGTLENQRIVAKRSRKYTDANAPALSLTPREASRASYGTHMSERVAFQAGQVLKEHVKAQTRSDYLNTNMRMFGSVDLLVQVKIAEMNVQIGDSPRPNLSRLATVCDLFDKVAATSESNYVALSLLRDELYASVFENYTASIGSELSKEAPSMQRTRQLSSFNAFTAESYASSTPFFIQVGRLKESLKTAEAQLSDALMHSGNKTRRMHLATAAVEKLSAQYLGTLLAHTFYCWTGVWTIAKWNAKLSLGLWKGNNARRLVFRTLAGWFKVVVKDKAETARRHIEREARKTEVYRAEAIKMARDTNAVGRQDLNKDEMRQISNAWEEFAVVAAGELLNDTRRMVEELCMPMLQDVRVLLRSAETSIGAGILDSLQGAPAEEWLLRWCETKVGIKEEFLTDWGESLLQHNVVSEIIKCAESEYMANEPAVEEGGGVKISFRRDSGVVLGGSMPPEAVAQAAAATADRIGVPNQHVDYLSLWSVSDSDSIFKVLFLANIFLAYPMMPFSKGKSLRDEYTAIQSSFDKLQTARALYVEGLDPVCRMAITMHKKVQMEHRGLVRSFALYSEARSKIHNLVNLLDRGGKGVNDNLQLRPEVAKVREINTGARLRLQKVQTVHSSHTGQGPLSSSGGGLLPTGGKTLVAFSYLVDNAATP